MEKEKLEFSEKAKLIEMQTASDKLRHENKMEELRFERETSKIIHEQILERGRISRMENRRNYADQRSGGWK